MVQVIPKHVRDAWEIWNIKGMLILSLSLQTILVLFAPSRRKTARKFLTILLWLSYLLADWSANFTVGLIAKNQGKESKPNDPPHDKNLMPLWAPFLLLHLGTPDTITAFSMEDNALWTRHLLGLFFQLLTGIYVVLLSLPNTFWLPTLLVFFAGTIKYGERIIALYMASSEKFGDSTLQAPNSSDPELMEVYASKRPINSGRSMNRYSSILLRPNRSLTHLEILQYGFKFFNDISSLMVSLVFIFDELGESRDLFELLTAEEALRIIELELGFIYDALYTKVLVLHTWTGSVFRFIALGSLLSAFFIFHNLAEKSNGFRRVDIVVTYTLFLVGIALDLAFFITFMLSDWTFAVISRLKKGREEKPTSIDPVLNWILGLKRLRWKKQICYKGEDLNIEHEVLKTPFLLRRWAGKVYGITFFLCLKADHEPRYCLSHYHRSMVRWAILVCGRTKSWSWKICYYLCDFLRLICNYKLAGGIRLRGSVSARAMTKNLWGSIFEDMRHKSQFVDELATAEKITQSRGEWALSQTQLTTKARGELMVFLNEDIDYDQILLQWHIATEICYQVEEPTLENFDNREISKTLSDYMIYLFLTKPKSIAEITGLWNTRFRDTLAEGNRFCRRRHLYEKNRVNVKLACENILSLDTDNSIIRGIKGDMSESVLFDAARLAKVLRRVDDDHGVTKWEIMSKVWVDLLIYAARHCDSTTRLEQLSSGGELINFVWLLIAHFGLGS